VKIEDHLHHRYGILFVYFAGDVLVMQQICAFELGLYNKSDWCQFFNMTDLEVIDYMIDLKVQV
jgi:hypothetical protein